MLGLKVERIIPQKLWWQLPLSVEELRRQMAQNALGGGPDDVPGSRASRVDEEGGRPEDDVPGSPVAGEGGRLEDGGPV